MRTDMDGVEERREPSGLDRARIGAGQGRWAGVAVAMFLGMRFLVPFIRGGGLVARYAVVGAAVGALPVGVWMEARRRREERRSAQIRAERARSRLARSRRAGNEEGDDG